MKNFEYIRKLTRIRDGKTTKREIVISGGWFLATLIAIFFIALGAVVFQIVLAFANALITHPWSWTDWFTLSLAVSIVCAILIIIVAIHNNRREQ